MQTGTAISAIITASHSVGRQIAQTAGQLIFDDQRLSGWSAAETGSLTLPAAPNWISASATYPGGLTSGVTYYYLVTTLTGLTQSTASPVASVTPTASASGCISWSGVVACSAYGVYRTVTANNFLSSARYIVSAVTAKDS